MAVPDTTKAKLEVYTLLAGADTDQVFSTSAYTNGSWKLHSVDLLPGATFSLIMSGTVDMSQLSRIRKLQQYLFDFQHIL